MKSAAITQGNIHIENCCDGCRNADEPGLNYPGFASKELQMNVN